MRKKTTKKMRKKTIKKEKKRNKFKKWGEKTEEELLSISFFVTESLYLFIHSFIHQFVHYYFYSFSNDYSLPFCFFPLNFICFSVNYCNELSFNNNNNNNNSYIYYNNVQFDY